jgi:hypothetical protein
MSELNYGGVALHFRGPSALLACLAKVAGEPHRDVPPAARVSCVLHDAAEPPAGSTASAERGWLRWQWRAGTAQVVTRGARALVWKADGGYAAEAWLPPNARVATTLVGALSSAVLHDAGGLLVHAASVLVDSRVVAFIGTSGAGKSTACRHMGGALIFSLDRLAVLPHDPGAPQLAHAVVPPVWFAYPLFGGTALDPAAPRAKPAWTPLATLLRVHRGDREPRIEPCGGPQALASLRESAFSGGTDPDTELDLLARIERLRLDVPVGRLHFGLGSSLVAPVSRWISGQAR